MQPNDGLARTGIPGLDNVLQGGLPRGRVILVEGHPGSGKTTLGMQFLMEGAARGERCLHVTLGESLAELREVASSHGWTLDGIETVELTAEHTVLNPASAYTVFEPAEVELDDTLGQVLAAVERTGPDRVVIDSLSEFRLLAESPLRYRHQTLALKQFLSGRGCTVLLLDDLTSGAGDLDLHSITHGVITLEQLSPEYGGARRRLRVVKLRAQAYRGGWHDFALERSGIQVFPQIASNGRGNRGADEKLRSGNAGLDAMLGGGVDRGAATTMLVGPSGSGKSTVAAHFAAAAAAKGECAAIFLFDERAETFLRRLDGMGIPLRAFVDGGTVSIQMVNPAELSPAQFAAAVQAAVEPTEGTPASVVVIDSLNAYFLAMPEERFSMLHLHELLTYLGRLGVATFTTNTQRGLIALNTGDATIEASYLADTVIAFRYFETVGEIHQAISVVKRRTGDHERTLRELRFTPDGIRIGEPLRGYRGLLTGVPTPVGDRAGEGGHDDAG